LLSCHVFLQSMDSCQDFNFLPIYNSHVCVFSSVAAVSKPAKWTDTHGHRETTAETEADSRGTTESEGPGTTAAPPGE